MMLGNGKQAESFERRRLRLSTVTNTRWLAVLGQGVTVAIVAGFLNFKIPLLPVVLLIFASIFLNIVLMAKFPGNRRIGQQALFNVLLFDMLQLAGLLYLTGGLVNPFSVLMMVPVVIAAASLPSAQTGILAVMAVIMASALAINHYPLPWYEGQTLNIPGLYVTGLWAAVLSSIGFTAHYIFKVASEARSLSDALAETELVLQREHHLHALDGLAAAAAHELGTPLATISLVAKEMALETPADSPLGEDIALLRTQADRCREILSRIATLHSGDAAPIAELGMLEMLDEIIAPHREFGVEITIVSESPDDDEPIVYRNPGLLYGLGNFVENAVDFARNEVIITVSWDEAHISVSVRDDGPGFSFEQIEKLGEPDLGSVPGADRKRKGSSGLGLGIFIAKTLLERTGASVTFANRTTGGSGANVLCRWARSSIDKNYA